VWPRLAASVSIKPANMNRPNTLESVLRDKSLCELGPLRRVKAGVAVGIKERRAWPDLRSRLPKLGWCEDFTCAAAMKGRRVKSRFSSHQFKQEGIAV